MLIWCHFAKCFVNIISYNSQPYVTSVLPDETKANMAVYLLKESEWQNSPNGCSEPLHHSALEELIV